MTLDILKTSFGVVAFGICLNSVVQTSHASWSDTDSDSESQPDACSIIRRLNNIGRSYVSPRKEAAGWVEKFNNGEQEVAIKCLYKMLETDSEQRKLASANALFELIAKTNPQPASRQEKSKLSTKGVTLTADVALNSCEISQLVENFSRNFCARLVAKAEADVSNGTGDIAFNPAVLKEQMTQFSDLTYYAKLLEQIGVKFDFKGKGALDIRVDPFGIPSFTSQSCGIDKGTEQAISKIICGFKYSPITPCVLTLLTKVLPYGTPKQRETIKGMMEDR